MYHSYLETPNEAIKEKDNMIISQAENDSEDEIQSLNSEILHKSDENDEEIDINKIYLHNNGIDSNQNDVKTTGSKETQEKTEDNKSTTKFITVNDDKNKKKVIFIIKKENNKKAKKNNKIIVELPPGYKFKIFTKAVSDYISNYWDPPVFKKVSKAKNKIESRKYNNDNIYKKLRGKIFNLVVEKLKNNFNVKFVFTKISQNSKKIVNKQYRNLTIEEVLKTVKENKKVFEELEKEKDLNKEVKEILNTKVEDIYKEYFNSEEFQKSIKKMSEKREKYYYIYLYIQKCINYFDYYNNGKIEIEEEEVENEL